MTAEFPKPGLGYTIREFVGAGNWKTAYRASSSNELADVALLYPNDEIAERFFAKDVYNILRSISGDPYAAYLTDFKGVLRGQDGKIFIVEEFLETPLDALAPVRDLVQFVRIVRDLNRGLLCLRRANLIHRDLKLDNCGLDRQQRAKIFDLGSVTSEAGEIRGSVLTRSPELFQDNAKCDFSSDVWALGATIFALRSGEYPFVLNNEVEARKIINGRVKLGEISRAKAQLQKNELDEIVASRISKPDAWSSLQSRVHSMLRGAAEEIVLAMLQFDPKRRLDIEGSELKWSNLAKELSGKSTAASATRGIDRWEVAKRQLEAARRQELVFTHGQIERLIAEFDRDESLRAESAKSASIKKLIEEVKLLSTA
jgi:serine/threonine protein kinase